MAELKGYLAHPPFRRDHAVAPPRGADGQPVARRSPTGGAVDPGLDVGRDGGGVATLLSGGPRGRAVFALSYFGTPASLT